MDIEHPTVSNLLQTGELDGITAYVYGHDYFGRETFVGDGILVLDDDFFLLEELAEDAVQLLLDFGAIQDIAGG